MRHRPVVLVIEDQDELLNVIQDVLDDEGYDVSAVRTPTEAMEVLHSKEVDLVVCDYAPSSGNDPDPLADVEGEFPDLPIIVFSDGDGQSIPFFGPWRMEGARMILPKPFKLDDLIAALREVVD